MSRPDRQDAHSRFDLRTVLESSRILIESQDREFVFEKLLLMLMGKLLVPKAAVLLLDAQQQTYTAAAAKGSLSHTALNDIPLPFPPSSKREAYMPAEALPEKARLTVFHPDGYFFNLRTSDAHLGWVYLNPKGTQTPFEEHELEFAESVCTITAASIANTTIVAELNQTNRRLDQRLHELNTLLDVAKEFNLLTDRQAIANAFKFTLMGQLFVRTFLLAYKDGDQMHLLASSNLNEKPSESLLRTLFESANDQGDLSDELRQRIPFLNENEITVLSRVLLEGESRAVIAVGKRGNQKPLTPSDLKFLDSLANLAVLSIQKTFFMEKQIEQQRLEEELNIAASIQQRLLPNPIPTIPGVDLAAGSVSSRQVGGDYFDVVELVDNRHLLAIGDVTGKGVPASLLMANLQSMLHTIAPLDLSLEQATGQINNQIFKNTPIDKFITFFWGILDPSNRSFKYVNAGHNPPLLLRSGYADFQELTEGGLLLGAMETMAPYESASIQLNHGDLLVLYTDGVSEAFSPNGKKEYGEKRLMKQILALRECTAQEIFDGIVADVKEFTGGQYSDDITLIVLKTQPEED